MRRFFTNRTITKGIFGFVMLLVFFIPVSLSVTALSNEGVVAMAVSVDSNVAFAQAAEKSMGATDFLKNPTGFIGYYFMQVAAFFTGIGGMLLDYSIEETVFKMGSKVSSSAPFGDTLNTIWSLVRDICNLAFIFGFIFVGIRTIIDPESASTKRFLSRIIIGALLINFSLFFAKAIIDFANFSAVQIYTQMTVGAGSISESVTNKLGLVTFFNPEKGGLVDGIPFSFYIMAGIFLFVTAFTFLAAALLLIVRFVALLLIMIASPILFAATVFPQTEHLASDLWKKLISYAFFAPVYLLLLIICLKIVEGLNIGITASGFADIFLKPGATAVTNLNIVLNFVIIIFFMIAALTIASKMGIAGGNLAISAGNWSRGKAQSIIGRNTIGRFSHRAKDQYEKLDARAEKATGWRRAVLKTRVLANSAIAGGDKGLRGVLEKGEKATFGGSDSLKSVKDYNKERNLRQANINKMSDFKEIIGASTKKDANGNPPPLTESQKIAYERAVADATVKDLEELKQEQREAIVGLMTKGQIEGLMKSEKLTDDDKRKLGEGRHTFVQDRFADRKEDLSKASTEYLTALGQAYLADEEHAIRLTSSQMDDLKKELTPTEYEKVTEARKTAQKKLAAGGMIQTVEKTGVVGLDKKHLLKQKATEIAKMHVDVLESLADELPVTALEKIVRDTTQSTPDQAKVRAKIEAGGNTELKDWLTNNPMGRQFGK